MTNIKEYMVSLLIITAILKLSSIIIDSTKFSKTYKIVSGLIITITVISPVVFFPKIDISKEYKLYNHDIIQNNKLSLNNKFASKLETVVNDDLNKRFNKEYRVTVKCDESFNFQIYLSGNHAEINEVAQYIKNKYCSKDNEVTFN